MAGKLFENGVDELFVEKPSWTSNTVTIGIEIPNFLKKMEEKKIVDSPSFKLSGLEFYVQVQAGTEKNPEFIGVFLFNCSKEVQTMSAIFVEGGMSWKFEMKEIGIEGNLVGVVGIPEFLSHEKFKAGDGDVFKLKATVTLHQKKTGDDWIRSKPKLKIPESLRSEASTSALTKSIMQDEDTSDFTVSCETKTFKVHKNFLCSRSPVLRAMILGQMKEAHKNEVFIEDINADTLASMISFIYTGDFEVGDTTDVQMVARAADKYDIKGFLELLCFKIKTGNIKNDLIADMLITADIYNSQELKAVALEKLRADRSIIKESGFRERMMKGGNKQLLFDLIDDLY